uniref:Uncharacterized protein n=1 Tax=Scophthalmus maximus TaxID=52904 RepID=A0A8D2ZPE9_SCOMX
MVEQTRQPRRVVSLQAGPGEVDTGALYDVNLSDRTVRAFARQLAAIGDQLDREWTEEMSIFHVIPLVASVFDWDIHSQLWGIQGLSAALKAWFVSTAAGPGVLRAEAWTAWVTLILLWHNT